MTDSATDDGELGGYAASMAEIESILASLEDDDVDIDTLASRVERASQLIAHCESRLRSTELSLQTILAQHEAAEPDTAAPNDMDS
ncbi:exodeoxyribonuclease VII small subunit [Candidatus Poriferisodalis sp.]|uniref:exodeoxyribonuclease VII small subunit n=1 Tax=Candidatus Poriferisodalis sp. TaxID=3101277 RepID=UPI003B028F76